MPRLPQPAPGTGRAPPQGVMRRAARPGTVLPLRDSPVGRSADGRRSEP
jgi:hypothetical protein